MSLGSILSTAAPIAAGYFTGGVGGPGFFGLSGAAAGIAAGAVTGAGIAALSGGDILSSGVMGGLGGYGGAQMATAFNPAAGVDASVKAGSTTAVANEAMLSPYTHVGSGISETAAGSQLGMFSNPQAVNLGNPVTNTAMSNAIGANTPVGLNSANVFPSNTVGANTPVGLNSATRATTESIAPGAYGTVPNPTTGSASRVPGIRDAYSGGYDPSKGVVGEVAYTTPGGYIDRSFSAGVERLGGGDSVMGYGKLGLAGLPVLASAYEPETFTYDQMKEAEAYDPDATLNLDDPALDSGIEDVIDSDSGLRLYAKEGGMIPTYAEGGTIESRAKKGMAGALARNKGIAYTRPTTAPSTPTTAPSSIKIAGAGNSTTNLTGGVGALNVGSGSIGQSANARAAEAAKPKTRMMTGAYGTQMTVPIDYDPGMNSVFGGRKPSHYQLKDGTYVKGTPPNYSTGFGDPHRFNAYGYVNKFAEGGTVETRADQGMRDALARNQGTAYAQPTTTASNVNTQPALNINRGMGSLNVNSGNIGQSANAIVEAARLKDIEDAKPKTPPMQFIMGQGMRPVGAIEAGPAANYSRDMMGGYTFKGKRYGGYAEGGMLEGPGDGMSDSLAAQIDGSQPAALSQGEFVVPADVVSHLGNGSSDAGSKRLYAMMDEVRQARTGTEKQGKEINPERYMPA